MKKAIILITTVSIITACNTDIIEVKHSDSSNYWQPQKKYISLDEAEQNLQKIIMDIKLNNTRASQNHDFNITSRYSTGMATTRSGCDSIPEIYVFNFGKNDGYAIMSSDIREPDLYALSLEGRLNPDSITDETDTRIFLTILKNHLKFIYGNQTDTTNNTITNNTKKNTNSVIVRYSPLETTNKIYKDGSIELCKVKWTQDYSSHMWLAHGLQIKSRKKTLWNPKNHELLQTIIEKQYYILCNMGYGGNYMDKYYLSGVFDARDSLLISMNTNYDNYRYNIRTITGVRK